MLLGSPHPHTKSRTTLYNRERKGQLLRIMPGVFISADTDLSTDNLMQWLSMRQPKVVMNLISALWHHRLTLQIPDALSVAAPRGTHIPTMQMVPVQVWYTKPELLKSGVEEASGDYGTYRVTTLERTLVDCFKYRNKLGLSVFTEALDMAGSRVNPWELQQHAVALHQFRQILPYLKRR